MLEACDQFDLMEGGGLEEVDESQFIQKFREFFSISTSQIADCFDETEKSQSFSDYFDEVDKRLKEYKSEDVLLNMEDYFDLCMIGEINDFEDASYANLSQLIKRVFNQDVKDLFVPYLRSIDEILGDIYEIGIDGFELVVFRKDEKGDSLVLRKRYVQAVKVGDDSIRNVQAFLKGTYEISGSFKLNAIEMAKEIILDLKEQEGIIENNN